MFGSLSTSALAAAATQCTDCDSAINLLDKLVSAWGAKCAMVYRFDRGLQSATEKWTPLYVNFPAEITEYYSENQCLAADGLVRAAFGAYLPVRLAEIVDSFEMSPKRQGLHALFAKHGVKDILGLHVYDRPGGVIYIALAYDRPLDDLSELDQRRLYASFEIFMRHTGALAEQAPAHALSPKERDVLRLLACGASNKEIARNLGLSPSTVNTLVTRSYGKLGARTRTQAAVAAARAGLSLVA